MANTLLGLKPNRQARSPACKIKNLARFKREILALILCAGLTACAHRYYYLPEIKGDGAMHAKNGSIDYTIPPKGIPELKMRVRTFGIQKVKGKQMLAMRISFARPTGEVNPKHPEREFMNPGEQTVRIGANQIKPAFVHTKARKDQLIELNGLASETIDFLFPIPAGNTGINEIEILYFQWLVHFGKGQVESQTARFDRYDAAPQQAAEPYPFDNDYPYDVSPMQMPGWYIDEDPFWWPGPWMM